MYQILTDVLHKFACNVENLRLDLFLTLMINGQLIMRYLLLVKQMLQFVKKQIK